jgi:CheY-like chemotaxis protein
MSLTDINLLLVDDDEVDVITVKRALTRAKIENPLFIGRDGIEALELLRGDVMPRERRVVLLDLNMPRMNGLELLREIRSDPALSTLTVIVMTTSNEERDRIEAFKLNVAGYIVKPVTFQGFIDAIAMLHEYWSLMEIE